MTFEVTILGSNSALPAAGRHPTAQILNIHDKPYLIDCGEGTQIQMNRYRVKRSGIDHIFISHLHGDHVLGLLPLINSYALNRRRNTLHIYGPLPIRRFIEHQLQCTESKLPYQIQFHEYEAGFSGKIMENESADVHAFPLDHRIPTMGYLFKEKKQPPHIVPGEMKRQKVSFLKAEAIKRGEVVENELGEKVRPEHLTRPAEKPRSYAFMSDTRYQPGLADQVRNADLLYHEATFLHELKEKAEQTRHTTAREAGKFAAEAGVGRLLIGHFSTRYQNLNPLIEETRTHFSESDLAIEGSVFTVPRQT